jgi:hypothetical protein
MILTIQQYTQNGDYYFFDWTDGLVHTKIGISGETNRLYFSFNTKEECLRQFEDNISIIASTMETFAAKYKLQLLLKDIRANHSAD